MCRYLLQREREREKEKASYQNFIFLYKYTHSTFLKEKYLFNFRLILALLKQSMIRLTSILRVKN